ncbi:MAG: S1 RNA-binding domain-containing protein [Anaerolineales bacterium]|jgi:small subunit ribosomal protein S1
MTNAEITSQEIKRKMHFVGKVVKTTLAGIIVDVGLEKMGVVHIAHLSENPVKRVEDVVQVGQEVDVWVRRVKKDQNHIEMTMIEPLALEWREIKKGMVVKGEVVRLEKFGAFIEIGAERPGLAHISELTHEYVRTPEDAVKVGDVVEAKIIDFSRRKKQIKLSLKALKEVPKEEVFEEVEEPVEVLTAMEVAYRKALDEQDEDTAESSEKTGGTEKPKSAQDDIISRTLEHKAKTK